MIDPAHPAREAVTRAFGAQNRRRLLHRYFSEQEGEPTAADAWKHVYRLLLWIDRTTALAHCYESDKAQPGRAWYARSLAFHAFVCQALDASPAALAEDIDWLFKEAVKDLATAAATSRSAAYERQRAPYAGQGYPEPGDDPELMAILKEVLGRWLSAEPPREELLKLTRQIYAHVTQENKRKNLVGEGFEDVLASIMNRLQFRPGTIIETRSLLHHLPGFHPPAPNEKPKRVDLAVVQGERRTLVTAKWSIRADREEQFLSDFQAYDRLEAAGTDFDYTLLTNEFDAARLKAACERRRQNAPLFTHVVHISPEAVAATYAESPGSAARAVSEHHREGRLLSLAGWLAQMSA
jgi:hypothetical protein